MFLQITGLYKQPQMFTFLKANFFKIIVTLINCKLSLLTISFQTIWIAWQDWSHDLRKWNIYKSFELLMTLEECVCVQTKYIWYLFNPSVLTETSSFIIAMVEHYECLVNLNERKNLHISKASMSPIENRLSPIPNWINIGAPTWVNTRQPIEFILLYRLN